MDERLEEIMQITQEECAEVVQAVSKVFRFGFDGEHKGKTNKAHLEEEIGDLLAMVELLYADGAIDEAEVNKASVNKLVKLNTWSKHIRLDLT
jgi:NTP pyrophosphatase (non-canonical NTP hydrolase)